MASNTETSIGPCLPSEEKIYSNCSNYTDSCFKFDNSSCYICNGHYGPCYDDDPVCATCHAFLFPINGFPASYYGSTEWQNAEDLRIPACLKRVTPVEMKPDSDEEELPMLKIGVKRRRLGKSPLDLSTNELSSGPDCHIPEQLPTEMLMEIFSRLDDHSLWRAGQVCQWWGQAVRSRLARSLWRDHTIRRWPLFKPEDPVDDWYSIYNSLLISATCKTCLFRMYDEPQPGGPELKINQGRLRREHEILNSFTSKDFEVTPLNKTRRRWAAKITGPVGTPYEGGVFHLLVQVALTYPFNPPLVRFVTKIFHPNVSRHGDVGIDCIRNNWKRVQTIWSVLVSIWSLLTDPFCEVCMEPVVGRIYRDNRRRFERVARSWTDRYAMHHTLVSDLSPDH